MLEKLNVDEIKPSSRKYPYINFKPEREIGDQVLSVEGLSKTAEDGSKLFENVTFRLNREDKVAFIGRNTLAITALFEDSSGADQT